MEACTKQLFISWLHCISINTKNEVKAILNYIYYMLFILFL